MVTKSYVKYTMLIEYAARIFVILKKKILFYLKCLNLEQAIIRCCLFATENV